MTAPDQATRSRIEQDLHLNMMVEASAGSGKTESLSRRIAHALVHGEAKVEEAAAVTFTRKAAAELRGRLRLTLESLLFHEEARERARVALDGLEQMFVGTIHSFCSHLLREYPVEAGVSPGFRELDKNAQSQLRDECLVESFEALRHHDPVLLRELSLAGLRPKDLSSALETVCGYQDVTYDYPREDMPDLEAAEGRLRAFKEEMEALVPEHLDEKATCGVQKAWRVFVHRFNQIDLARPLTVVRCMELWKANLKLVKKWWPSNSREAGECAGDFAELHAEPFVRRWRSYLYGRVLALLNMAREHFHELRLSTAQLDFNDLLWLSARLLRENLGVRRKAQMKFRWLFVDEFQDTDPLQAEVVTLLASKADFAGSDWLSAPLRPGALFVVGDPKQSIYRFRRADIDVVTRVQERILASGGVCLTLTASFRSVPELCTWTNRAFSSLFPAQGVPGQAAYSPLEAVREQGETGLTGVFTLTDHEGGYKEVSGREAQRLARQITTAVRDHGYRWGDFLILTARRAEVSVYSQALESYRVPVDVTGGKAPGHVWVEALKQLLYVLADPGDSVAVVGVLRGRLYGVDDETLYQHRQSGGHFRYNAAGGEGHDLVLGALADLSEMKSWIEELPTGAAVEKILGHTGMLAVASTSNEGEGEVPALIQLVDSLRRFTSEGRSLAQALDFIEMEESVYPVALNSGRRDVVRVMNLHQAKGLQAPVVVLVAPTSGYPETVRHRIVRDGQRALGYLSMVSGYKVLAEPLDWNEHEAVELEYQQYERVRLLYVAATRARDALVVSRWTGTHKSPKRPWQALEEFLDEAVEFPIEALEALLPEVAPPSLEEADQASLELRARWAECARPGWSRTSVTAMRAGDKLNTMDLPVPEEISPDAGTEWGDLIHRLLEQLVRNRELTDDELTRLTHWYLYDTPELIEMAPRAVSTVREIMKSEFWQGVLAAKKRLVEVPFGVSVSEGGGRRLVFGVVDLALESDQGWDLVDYKTDRKEMDSLLATYAGQLQEYARRWSGLAGEVQSARLFRVRSMELSEDVGGPRVP